MKVREFLPVAAAFALCPLAAAFAPSDPAGPLARADALVAFERSLGLYVEPVVAAWFAARPGLLAVVEFLYLWGHVPATVGALVWARLEHPRAFGPARDAFVATQAVVVAGYLLVPTAPPRMLAAYGAERPEGGLIALLQSPFAALPSGHVAFAVVTAGVVSALAAWRWVRWIAPLYPLLVTLVVIGTANHFWIDAVAGAGAVAIGWALSVIVRTRTRQVAARSVREPRTEGDVGRNPASTPRRVRPATSA